MHWYFYAAYFLGGAFLANAVPHFASPAMLASLLVPVMAALELRFMTRFS